MVRLDKLTLACPNLMNQHLFLRRTNRARLCAVITVGFAILGALPRGAVAQLSLWVNPSGGLFESAGNWAPLGVPSSSSSISFGLAADYKVGLLSEKTVSGFTAGNGTEVTLGIGGPASERTLNVEGEASIDNGALALQGNESARFNMNIDGALSFSGAKQHLTLDGGAINATGNLTFAGGSPKSLIVRNDSSVTNDTTEINVVQGAEIRVMGTDTSWTMDRFDVPFSSEPGAVLPTFDLNGGATVTAETFTIFERGWLVVEGVGDDDLPTTWNTGFASFPNPNTLHLRSGAVINSDNVTIGSGGAGSGDYFIQGGDDPDQIATWNIDGQLVMSGSGPELSVETGGLLKTQSASLRALGNASIDLSNFTGEARSRWENAGDLFVGGDDSSEIGVGLINIFHQGSVEVGGTMKIWPQSNVTLRPGAELIVDTIDEVSGDGFDFVGGTLQVSQHNSDLDNPNGRLTPGGDAVDDTLIIGDYVQGPTATLALDVGGTTPGVSHDLLEVAGPAAVDGLLELTLINGFIPSSNDTFIVAAASNIVGAFNNAANGERVITSDGFGSFVVNYGLSSAFDTNQVVLSDYAPSGLLPGDYNDDGVVDAADYTKWRDHLGDPAGSLNSDNDIDGGEIGQAQYDTWRANYGLPTLASISIPEPHAVTLALLGWAWVPFGTTNRRER